MEGKQNKIEKEPELYFGGIDFYGIDSSEIKLPEEMSKIGDLASANYIENTLKPTIEEQIKDYEYRDVGKVRFIGNKMYLVVDVSSNDYQNLFEPREFKKELYNLSKENLELFEEWDKTLKEAWKLDKLNPDSPENFKRLNEVEEKIREKLNKDKNLVDNIKNVLESGQKEDLENASMMCHWTPKDDKSILKNLELLILNPDSETRNNASRSILDNYSHSIKEVDIQRFLKQLQLPFHSDRNKALFVLREYSKLPEYKEELLKYKKDFEKFSKAVMPNISEPALGILKNILV